MYYNPTTQLDGRKNVISIIAYSFRLCLLFSTSMFRISTQHMNVYSNSNEPIPIFSANETASWVALIVKVEKHHAIMDLLRVMRSGSFYHVFHRYVAFYIVGIKYLRISYDAAITSK